MLVGDSQPFYAFDIDGKTLTRTAKWTLTDTRSGSLLSQNPPLVSSIAPGVFTIRATIEGHSAEAQITAFNPDLTCGSLVAIAHRQPFPRAPRTWTPTNVSVCVPDCGMPGAKGKALGAATKDSGHEEDCITTCHRRWLETNRQRDGCWGRNYLSRRPAGLKSLPIDERFLPVRSYQTSPHPIVAFRLG
jgi:hypothetical protein